MDNYSSDSDVQSYTDDDEIEELPPITTHTNSIVPNLDIRTARVYSFVENQSSGGGEREIASARTNRDIQQLRLATNNAENRLQQLEQLSARLANEASGDLWWEERWNLLNGRMSSTPGDIRNLVANVSDSNNDSSSLLFNDDLPQPRCWPNRPKMKSTTSNWTQSGRRVIHPPHHHTNRGTTNIVSPLNASPVHCYAHDPTGRGERIRMQEKEKIKERGRIMRKSKLQRLILQGAVLNARRKEIRTRTSPPRSIFRSKSRQQRKAGQLPPRPSNTPKINPRRRGDRRSDEDNGEDSDDDGGEYSSEDEDFAIDRNSSSSHENRSGTSFGNRKRPQSNLENVPEVQEEDDEEEENEDEYYNNNKNENDDDDNDDDNDDDDDKYEDDDDFIKESDMQKDEDDEYDDDFIQDDDSESEEEGGEEKRVNEERRVHQTKTLINEKEEEEDLMIGSQIRGGDKKEMLLFGDDQELLVTPPQSLTVATLRLTTTTLASSPRRVHRSTCNSAHNKKRRQETTKNDNVVYLRLSWSPCNNAIEYIVEMFSDDEDDARYSEWLTCYHGPAPLCVLRIQRPRSPRNEKKELRFRIFSIDMEGMSSNSSKTFRHFIEEPPKGEHNDTRNVRPVMPLRRRNGSGNRNQIPLRSSPEKVYQKSKVENVKKHVV